MAANILKIEGERVDSLEEFQRSEKSGEWRNVLYYPETLASEDRRPLMFKNKRFFEVSFKDTDISKVNFIRCTFERCLFIGASLTDCEFIDCRFINTNTNKCRITRCLIDPRDFDENFDFKADTNIAVDLYQRLYKNLIEEHQPERAFESLYRMRKAEYHHLDSERKRGIIDSKEYVLKKIGSWSYDFISGYGMKALRVLRFVLILLAFFSVTNYLLRNAFFENGKICSFVDAVYFSCVTVTTLGFGDIVPVTQVGRVFISLEAFMGVIVISLFLSAVANRALRSR